MATLFPTSSILPGIVVNLGTLDSAEVGATVNLASTAQSCIVGTGSNQDVTVSGTVGADRYGILLGAAGEINETVTVNAGALVRGGAGGVSILANDSEVQNEGTIRSINGTGVSFAGNSNTTDSTLDNAAGAIIRGRTDGVSVNGTESFILNNAGTIRGANAFNSTGGSDDTIVNAGTLNGNVRLGLGNDIYNGQGGQLTGTVFGGGGNDRIICGTGNETINGGIGDDRLRGNQGADTLSGGTDADRFLFGSINDSTVAASDTIQDFDSVDGDIVNLRQIDADTATAGNQAFSFIGATAFSGKAGELRADTAVGGTVVRGDVDGDRTADFAIVFSGVADIAATDFLL